MEPETPHFGGQSGLGQLAAWKDSSCILTGLISTSQQHYHQLPNCETYAHRDGVFFDPLQLAVSVLLVRAFWRTPHRHIRRMGALWEQSVEGALGVHWMLQSMM